MFGTNIKSRVMQVIKARINNAQKRYNEQEKALHEKHKQAIAEMNTELVLRKARVADDLVAEVFNVR